MPSERFFEDLSVGQTFTSGSYTVTADEVIAFAQQYDPQPFHTDPIAASTSVFGRHVASGWHTAAMTMRLLIDGDFRPAGGSLGAGVEALRWTRPVVPGDVLHLLVRVVELRPSRSKPDRGIVKSHVVTLNASDEVVQELTLNSIVPRKPPSGA